MPGSLDVGSAVRPSWLGVVLPCGARVVKVEDGLPSRLSDEGLWAWLAARAEDEVREQRLRLTGSAALGPDGLEQVDTCEWYALYDAFERQALDDLQLLTGRVPDYEDTFSGHYGTRSLNRHADISWRPRRLQAREDSAQSAPPGPEGAPFSVMLREHLRRAADSLGRAADALNDAYALSLGASNFAWVQTQVTALEELRLVLRAEVEDAQVSPLPPGVPAPAESGARWAERLSRAWAALRGQ